MVNADLHVSKWRHVSVTSTTILTTFMFRSSQEPGSNQNFVPQLKLCFSSKEEKL